MRKKTVTKTTTNSTYKEFLTENSFYTNQTEKEAFLADKQALCSAFFITLFGAVALFSISSQRGSIKNYFAEDGPQRLTVITDENKDTSLVIKLMADKGYLRSNIANNLTRFMVKLKGRQLKSKDIDPNTIRGWLDMIQYTVHRPHPQVLFGIKKFHEGLWGLPQLAKHFHQISRRIKELKAITGEFRALSHGYMNFYVSINMNDFVGPVIAPRTQAPVSVVVNTTATTVAKVEAKAVEAPVKPKITDIAHAINTTKGRSFTQILATFNIKSADYELDELIDLWLVGNKKKGDYNSNAIAILTPFAPALAFRMLGALLLADESQFNALMKDHEHLFITNAASSHSDLISDLKNLFWKKAAEALRPTVTPLDDRSASRATLMFNQACSTYSKYFRLYLTGRVSTPLDLFSFPNAFDKALVMKIALAMLVHEKDIDAFHPIAVRAGYMPTKENGVVAWKEYDFGVGAKSYIDAHVDKDNLLVNHYGFGDVSKVTNPEFIRVYNDFLYAGNVRTFLISLGSTELRGRLDEFALYVKERLNGHSAFMSKEYQTTVVSGLFLQIIVKNLTPANVGPAMYNVLNDYVKAKANDPANKKVITQIILDTFTTISNPASLLVAKEVLDKDKSNAMQIVKQYDAGRFFNTFNHTGYGTEHVLDINDFVAEFNIEEFVLKFYDSFITQRNRFSSIPKNLSDDNVRILFRSLKRDYSNLQIGYLIILELLSLYPDLKNEATSTDAALFIDKIRTVRYSDGLKSLDPLIPYFMHSVSLMTAEEKETTIANIKVIMNSSNLVDSRTNKQYTEMLALFIGKDKADAFVKQTIIDRVYSDQTRLSDRINIITNSIKANDDSTVAILKGGMLMRSFVYSEEFTATFSDAITKYPNDFDAEAHKQIVEYAVRSLPQNARSNGEKAIIDMAGNVFRNFLSVYPAEAEAVFNAFDAKAKKDIGNGILQGHFIKGAHERLLSDSNPIKPKINLTTDRINAIMKYNNITPPRRVAFSDKTTLKDVLKKIDTAPTIRDQHIVVEDKTEKELEVMSVEYDVYNRRKHGNTGLRFLKSFTVAIPEQQSGFDEFNAKHMIDAGEASAIMKPVFHGTGSVAASMVLRYGFAVIKSGDASVAGRALGDGIYFSNVIDKVAQYIGDNGYANGRRGIGNVGYIFEMEASLGKRREDYSHAGTKLPGDRAPHFVSPEWCVFTPNKQLRIYKGYEVQMISGDDMDKMKEANNINESTAVKITAFESFLQESKVKEYKHCTTYVFQDGNIPINKKEFVDFNKFSDKKYGGRVRLDWTAQGPSIMIYNHNESDLYVVAHTASFMKDRREFDKFLKLLEAK